MHLVILLCLLALPGLAIHTLGSHSLWVVLYALAVNAITFGVYALDKKRAREGAWRVRETVLHALEFLGGWPGAFLAQRRLLHKCSKIRYQVVFWIIVAVHQLLALDLVTGCHLSRSAFSAFSGK